MRRRLLLLLTLVALPLAPAPRASAQEVTQQPGAYGAHEAAWARYTYPAEEFSAELPGMPFVMHTQRGVGSYPQKLEKVRVFGRYSGGVVFFVAAYDRPRSSESLDLFASYLRGGWEVSPKGEAMLGGFEGRAYSVKGRPRGSYSYELYGEGRVFRTKKHAYFALAFSPEEGRPEVERFLNSFELSPSPSGEKVAESAPIPSFARSRATPESAAGPGGSGSGSGSGSGDGDEEERLRLVRRGVGAPARDPNARRAIIVYRPEPKYTEAARKGRTRGVVRLRLVLGPAGEVRDVSVIQGLPDGLTESAADAARHMLFFPATKDGRPVTQSVVVEYSFNIY